jgi:DNA-binding transcriptional ArsR family regulator
VNNLVKEVNELHANICQALADPKRILILYALGEKPCNVTEIAESLDIPQPTVSRHLKMLRERGLVVGERQANSVIYSLADRRVIEALDIMRAVLADLLSHSAQLVEKIDQ